MYSVYDLSRPLVQTDENGNSYHVMSVIRHYPNGLCKAVATFFGNNAKKVSKLANKYALDLCEAAVEEAF